MPGIPLLNIGTALGGLAGGWNQARSQGLQQALQQLMQQQYQDQSTGQALASLAAQAGLLNQPQTPLGQSFPSPQQPPNVNIANITPPAQSSSGGGAPPGYAPPLSPGGPTAPGDMTSADEVQLNADAGQNQFGATNQAIQAAGFGDQTASSGGSDATPTSTPTPTPLPTQIERGSGVSGTTPAQSADSGQQSGGGAQQAYGIPLGNGQVMPLSSFFQQTDYQKLAQGVARLAPPGTSQAAIYSAVVDLAKLSEGDRTQQQQAGLLLRAMYGGNLKLQEIDLANQGREKVAGMQAGSRQQAVQTQTQSREKIAGMQDATKRYIADQTAQIRRDTLSANTTAKWAQIAQKQQEIANRLAAQGQTEAARLMSLQLSALRARISTIATTATGSGGTLTEDQTRELQDLNNRAAAIATQATGQGAGP